MKSINEIELIQQAQQGDGRAYAALFKKHKNQIEKITYGYFWDRADHKDAVAEIMVKIFYALPKYRPDCAFCTWYNAVAKNYCIDKLRKRKIETVSIDTVFTGHFSDQINKEQEMISYEEEMIKSENYRRMERILIGLKPKFYWPIYLYYFKKKGCVMIAEELNISYSAVKQNIHRGKKEIRVVYFHDKQYLNK